MVGAAGSSVQLSQALSRGEHHAHEKRIAKLAYGATGEYLHQVDDRSRALIRVVAGRNEVLFCWCSNRMCVENPLSIVLRRLLHTPHVHLQAFSPRPRTSLP